MRNYVTVPIKIVVGSTEELYQDIGIDDPTEKYIDFHFDPSEVIAYREDPPTEESAVSGVVFSLPNEEYYTEIPISEFETLIGVTNGKT